MYKFSHLDPHRNLRCLSLSGGGVRGIIAARILKELESALDVDTSKTFDLFCGTSIGGIIALGLATGSSGEQLHEIILRKSRTIFGYPQWPNPFGIMGPRHLASGLKKVVLEVLGDKSELLLSELEMPVLLLAVNGSTNLIEYFGNVGHLNGQACKDAPLIDAALATSAAPIFLPPHVFNSEIFLDGGLVSNNPDHEAFQVAVNRFARTRDSVKILSIGTGRVSTEAMTRIDRKPTSIQWMRRLGLIDRLMQMQSLKPSLEVSSALGANYLRIEVELKNQVKLDDWSEQTLNSLSNAAAEKVRSLMTQDAGYLSGFVR